MLIMKQFTSIDNIGYFNYYVATYNNLDKGVENGKRYEKKITMFCRF